MSAVPAYDRSPQYLEGRNTLRDFNGRHDGGPPIDSDTRLTRVETLCESLQSNMQDVRSDIRDIRSEMRNMRLNIQSEMSSLRKWILATGVAIVVGIGGIVASQITWYTYSLDRNRDEWKLEQAENKANFERMMKKIDEQGARIDAHLAELRELRHEHDKRLYKLESLKNQ